MKKIIKLSLIPMIGMPIVALSVGIGEIIKDSIASNKEVEFKKSIQKGYSFDGKPFNNYEEILYYLINEKGMKIDEETVIGDIRGSYIDPNYGTLNKAYLHDYISSNVEFAWQKANGELTRDYNEAKRTYFNEGLINIRFTDGFNNLFFSEQEAKESRDKNIVLPYQGYYELPNLGTLNKKIDFSDLSESSIPKIPSPTMKINPLNTADVDYLKNTIQTNFEHLIARNFVAPFEDLPFEIEYDMASNGSSPSIIESDFNFDSYADNFSDLVYPMEIFGTSANPNTIPYRIERTGWRINDIYMDSPLVSSTVKSTLSSVVSGPRQSFKFNYSVTEHAGSEGKWSIWDRKNGIDYTNDNMIQFFIKRNWNDQAVKNEKLKIGDPNDWDFHFIELSRHYGLNDFDNKTLTDLYEHSSNKSKIMDGYFKSKKISESSFEDQLRNSLLGKLVYRNNGGMYDIKISDKASEKIIKNLVTFDIGYNQEMDETNSKTNQFSFSVTDSNVFDHMSVTNMYNLHIKMKPKQDQKPTGMANVTLTQKNYSGITNELTKNIVGKLLTTQKVNSLKFKVNLKNKITGLRDHIFDVKWNLNNNTNKVEVALPSQNSKDVDLYLRSENSSDPNNPNVVTKETLENFDKSMPIISERDNPMVLQHSYVELIKQYWSSVGNSVRNAKVASKTKLYESVKFNSNNILYLPNQQVKFGRYVLTSYNLLNPSLNPENTKLIAGTFVSTVQDANNLKNNYTSKLSRPAEVYIAYNLNGEVINVGGDALYDHFDVIKENIEKSITPKKSQTYLFIKGYNIPVINKISNIYKLVLLGKVIYFDSNDNLTKYVMNYIYNNAKEVL